MQFTGTDWVVWLASFVGEVILLWVLFVRHRAKSFPLFTALVAWNLPRALLLYGVAHYGSRPEYFYAYWSLAIVDYLLQIGIFVEIAACTFRPLGTWATDVRGAFGWMVAGSVGLAAALTWWASPVAKRVIVSVAEKGNFFSYALLSELLLGCLLLSTWAGLPWKTHAARISQGLGVYSALGLITEGAHSLKSSSSLLIYYFWSHVQGVCYLVCLGYWIVTLWAEAPAPRELPEKLRSELARLNRMLGSGA